MRSATWIVSALATAVLFASGVQAAETGGTGASTDRPARGMSMEKVEAQFGAPARRVPAVGEPPITRWEYPGFTVYFEHHLVIHAVAVG